jgi:hypothetical protein
VDELHPDVRIPLRGYVVRREPASDENRNAVGIVFAEEVEPDRATG